MRRWCSVFAVIAFAAAFSSLLALSAASQTRSAEASAQESSSQKPYFQIVDNSMPSRFEAAGWESHPADSHTYGESYAFLLHKHTSEDVASAAARYRVSIPTTDYYSVYALWPASPQNTTSARFGVPTASGARWTTIDQRADGGLWVRIGAYKMDQGERTLQISGDISGDGRVVADAVMVVEDALVGAGGQTASTADPEQLAGDEGEASFSTQSISDPTRRDIVLTAKNYLDISYRYGVCTSELMSCTCLAKQTFGAFGHTLPMTEYGQWRYEGARRVAKADRRLGDILFFKESGRSGPITHVGIYSGHGNIVHSSSYFGKVVESELKYISGFWGVKRLTLR
jgi:cell wall-associated NlpC family hydrolase